MDTSGLRTAYDDFVAEATVGGFGPPSDGSWFAERLVAHVTVNDGLLAAVAERLRSGEYPSYDNAPAIDEHALDRFAHALGAGRLWSRGAAQRRPAVRRPGPAL